MRCLNGEEHEVMYYMGIRLRRSRKCQAFRRFLLRLHVCPLKLLLCTPATSENLQYREIPAGRALYSSSQLYVFTPAISSRLLSRQRAKRSQHAYQTNHRSTHARSDPGRRPMLTTNTDAPERPCPRSRHCWRYATSPDNRHTQGGVISRAHIS